MKKFFVLFCAPHAAMQKWMQETSEGDRKSQMDEMMSSWKAWADAHKESIADQGMPLGKTKRVTEGGIADVKNDLNYCMTIQAESHEAAAEVMKGNPHLALIPESFIEVMDLPQMGI